MNNQVAVLDQVITKGNLAALSDADRVLYYKKVCESAGLNPLTKPFEYITLNGKLTLYALRGCADQLRSIHGVSVEEISSVEREGVIIVTAKVKDSHGRTDVSTGAVTITGLKGDALANALMKAETKAKRRATLSICGLGILDETEIETIPRDMGATTGSVTAKEAYGSVKLMKEKWAEIASKINGCNTDAELDRVQKDYKVDFANFRAIDETLFDNLCQLGQSRRDTIREQEGDKELDKLMDDKIGEV